MNNFIFNSIYKNAKNLRENRTSLKEEYHSYGHYDVDEDETKDFLAKVLVNGKRYFVLGKVDYQANGTTSWDPWCPPDFDGMEQTSIYIDSIFNEDGDFLIGNENSTYIDENLSDICNNEFDLIKKSNSEYEYVVEFDSLIMREYLSNYLIKSVYDTRKEDFDFDLNKNYKSSNICTEYERSKDFLEKIASEVNYSTEYENSIEEIFFY